MVLPQHAGGLLTASHMSTSRAAGRVLGEVCFLWSRVRAYNQGCDCWASCWRSCSCHRGALLEQRSLKRRPLALRLAAQHARGIVLSSPDEPLSSELQCCPV